MASDGSDGGSQGSTPQPISSQNVRGSTSESDRESARFPSGSDAMVVRSSSQVFIYSSQSRKRGPFSRLLTWFLFTVVIGLLPFLTTFIDILLSGGSLTMRVLLGGGELFIFSAALSAGATGDLFAANFPASLRNYQIIGGAFAMFCALANAVAYAEVNSQSPPSTVTTMSLVLFILSGLTSAFCIGLATDR